MAQVQLTLDEDTIGGDGEAELTGWLVDDGADVDVEQPVAELSTSKAIIEVPAPAAGTLKQLVDVGAMVVPGQPIAEIEA